MSIKTKTPEEDPETKARREAAEARADAGRIDETRETLAEDTRAFFRQFGRVSPPASIGNQTAPAAGFNLNNLFTTLGGGGFTGGTLSGARLNNSTSNVNIQQQ